MFLLPFPKVEHLFCMFIGHLCFCDVYIQVLCLFLSFLFFWLIFKSSLFILCTNYLLVDGLQISSPNLWLVLSLHSLLMRKVHNFNELNCSVFYAFYIIFRKSSSTRHAILTNTRVYVSVTWHLIWHLVPIFAWLERPTSQELCLYCLWSYRVRRFFLK